MADLNKLYQKPFLTPKEVAGVLGLNVYTVYDLLRSGELKGIKLRPKAWRIKKEALDAYLKRKEAGGVEERVKTF